MIKEKQIIERDGEIEEIVIEESEDVAMLRQAILELADIVLGSMEGE